ncbi:hypothetical protein ACLQ2Q_17680 [Microbacterium sp. DT81.1]|uniref:hypothetical protein n=1 Tax=Microbacterium sp. DT81.1 TaxID=3393413 RepID=UPI003CFB4C1F
MEWTADVSAGDWLRERLDADWSSSSMHQVVPRGFPAYARIFHRATRDRPADRPWPPLPYAAHAREWRLFQAADPPIDVERVSWAETARAFDTVMHPLAQWHRLVGHDPADPLSEDGPRDRRGWRYGDPPAGDLDAETLRVVAGVLAQHTGTPADGCVGVWSGWGGLVGFVGAAPARTLFQLSDQDAGGDAVGAASLAQHNDMLGHSTRDPFNKVFRQPSWQPGILPDEISKGPRLELPAREHLLFRGGVAELAEPDWTQRSPWRDRELEKHGFPPGAQSPSVVWPADRAWVLVSEVDYDSTIVAGDAALVRALVDDPRLEAAAVPAGADLSWDGDEVNG